MSGNDIPDLEQQKILELLRRNQALAEQLWQAVAKNQLQLVEQLRQDGASINQAAHWKETAYPNHTPLTVAIQASHPAMVALLLKDMFNSTLVMEVNGKTALQMAIDLTQQNPKQAPAYRNIIQQLIDAYQTKGLALPLAARDWQALPENRAESKQTSPTSASPLSERKKTSSLPPDTETLEAPQARFFRPPTSEAPTGSLLQTQGSDRDILSTAPSTTHRTSDTVSSSTTTTTVTSQPLLTIWTQPHTSRTATTLATMPSSPPESKGQYFLKEIQKLLSEIYPPTNPQYLDTYNLYDAQLQELGPSNIKELRDIYKELQTALEKREQSMGLSMS